MKKFELAFLCQRVAATTKAVHKPTREAVCIRRGHRPWTDSERARLLELHEAGRTPSQMAKLLGRSVPAVKAQLQFRP